MVIGHRGACGYLPEHTLASYELAARQGADFLEPDLVATRDGVLVARHENEISTTTDVADHPELADRRTTRTVDGVEVTGWFTEDLTLAELRTLRAVERLPQLRAANVSHDGVHPVPTFAEILDLRARLGRELGREIGVYPETKHPTHFRERGLALEEPLLDALRGAGLDSEEAPVFVQSFELSNLVHLRRVLGSRARQVLLVTAEDETPWDLAHPAGPWPDAPGLCPAGRTYGDVLSPAGLAALRGVVEGLGPDKEMVLPWSPDGTLGPATRLVADAHAAGMVVHPWTFRAENAFLPPELRAGGDPAGHGHLRTELTAYLEAGVDGVFSDHPDLAVAARDALHPPTP
ncbi:glycerophosphodiester phosphodiesterase [Ornithinimicrobium humiphilum]|uniref:glycerophosphodiester phosphodiesterase n=1 Tax=Ornithinimicrobium humiphilum TaxID=125288 RepID=A0A543KPU9_9MICO|nr:glycerophosphoryl diester phosphodiesterase [Ornithinimicrobium humiphilum]